MSLLKRDQILLLLNRLKWEPIYEDGALVLCRKRGIGYSDDPAIGAIEAALSIALQIEAGR